MPQAPGRSSSRARSDVAAFEAENVRIVRVQTSIVLPVPARPKSRRAKSIPSALAGTGDSPAIPPMRVDVSAHTVADMTSGRQRGSQRIKRARK